MYTSTSDDTEFSELLKDDREYRPHPKKNLEDMYTKLVKNVEELNKKHTDTEKKIESLSNKNEEFIQKNQLLIDELKDNK